MYVATSNIEHEMAATGMLSPSLSTGLVGSFFNGGIAFNAATFLMAIAGLILGGVALWIALVQLKRTLTAARAARTAAESAKAATEALSGLLEITRLRRLPESIAHLTRFGEWFAASCRAADLRRGLSELRELPATANLVDAKEWQRQITRCSTMERNLQDAPDSADGRADTIGACIKCCATLDELLSQLAARQAGTIGVKNDSPED